MTPKLSNKQRLLLVQDILKKYTDEDNQLTISEIIDLMDTEEVVSKSAVRSDLKELASSRLFDVVENQESNGVEKYFSHQFRLFEVHELRVLVDAVAAARFITTSDTEKLIRKLKKLTSNHLAEQLSNLLHLSSGVKTDNKWIKHIIYDLHTATYNKITIQFQYGKYNVDKQFEFNRNGENYTVKPYSLIWNSEYYYLIGELEPVGEIRHYRVDRMRNISITDCTFIPNQNINIDTYTQKLFHMYTGEEKSVEIEFDAHLINVVIDRFGINVPIQRNGGDSFVVKTNVVVSDGFIRWLLTWGSDAKVIHPPTLVERMKVEVKKMYNNYH